MDMTGRILYDETVIVPETALNVSNLPKGMYILNISGSSFQTSEKLIIR
jgi:hypothetical protein